MEREYPKFMEQLIHFPLAAHDDGSGALAGALMRTPVHGRACRRDRADHGVHRGQESVPAGGNLSTRAVMALRSFKMGFAHASPPRCAP